MQVCRIRIQLSHQVVHGKEGWGCEGMMMSGSLFYVNDPRSTESIARQPVYHNIRRLGRGLDSSRILFYNIIDFDKY